MGVAYPSTPARHRVLIVCIVVFLLTICVQVGLDALPDACEWAGLACMPAGGLASREVSLASLQLRGMNGTLCQNADFSPEHKTAVWTMVTDNPNYLASALKMGHSVRTHTTDQNFDLVVMELVTKPLASTARKFLKEMGWKRCVVDRIAPLDELGTQTRQSRFLDQFTKLHLWRMTMYETLLYLDSDTLALRSVGHLLRRNLGEKRIAVAPQMWYGKFEGFNMGVFVMHPDMAEYERLLRLQQDPSVKFDASWAEQGFLNVVYKDVWDDLGFVNNALAWVYYQDQSYWHKRSAEINIIHYTGVKPWICVPDDWFTWLSAPSNYYTPLCQLWRDAHPQQTGAVIKPST